MQLFTLLAQHSYLAATAAAILGLCVGSFLNVVIYRTPMIMMREWRQESGQFWQTQDDLPKSCKDALIKACQSDSPISLSYPASSCLNCGHKIRFYENIPIVSWLFLKGKCASCQNHISMRYPLVELITAALSFLVVISLGATTQALFALVFLWILLALTGIDFDTQLLPDRLVYPLGMLGLFVNSNALFVSAKSSILGAIFGFLVFWVVARVYMLLKKREGMGFGDFKLMAAIGAWLGVGMLPLLVLLSAVFGTIFGGILVGFKRQTNFAFGPYIALAGLICMLWGESLLRWYLGQF